MHRLVPFALSLLLGLLPAAAGTGRPGDIRVRETDDYVQVDTGLVKLASGDRFVLCSDGLHGYLRESDIAPIVALGGEDTVKKFIALANERGGKDNITIVLVKVIDRHASALVN